MATYAGSCHCGALAIDFRSEKSPAQLGARSCQCSFCRKHNASWTSDPHGAATITSSREPLRYRFGTKTADFLICSICGVVVAAVSKMAQGLRGVIRVDALADAAAFLEQGAAMDLDGELLEARMERRAERWTPFEFKGIVA